MFKQFVIILMSVIYLEGVYSVPYIKPCKWDDSACMRASAQAAIPVMAAGIPELGVAVSDPMLIQKLSTNNAGLNLELSQISITGLSQCKVGKVSRDIEKSTIVYSMRCPIKLESHYNVSGNLIILPIEGNGEFSFIAENVKMKLEAKLEELTGADGKKHWKVGDYKHTYQPDKVTVRINNLFGGNEKAAAPVLDFINQQWRVFIDTVGKPFIDESVKLMVENINKWLAGVPIDELQAV